MKPTNPNLHNGLYRSRDGLFFGVCKGLAEWRNFSVFWMRLFTVIIAFLTGFWPVIIAYVFAAMFMKPKPVVPFEHDEDREFYDSYVNSRQLALKRLKKVADSLERRTIRLESRVLDREADWDRRFKSQS